MSVPRISLIRRDQPFRRPSFRAVALGAGVLACAVLAGCGTAVASSAAAASAAQWRTQSPPDAKGTVDHGLSCAPTGTCMLFGNGDGASDTVSHVAELWNGKRWSRVAGPGNARYSVFGGACVSATWCDEVGITRRGKTLFATVQHWNGTSWTTTELASPPGSTQSFLKDISCSSRDACTAVGQFQLARGVTQPLAERWNGSTWRRQKLPPPAGGDNDLSWVSCPGAHACRAVGTDAAGQFSEVWNGSSWKIRALPYPRNTVDPDPASISCASASACILTGSVNSPLYQVAVYDVWNGSTWATHKASLPGSGRNAGLGDVSCISARDCEATGWRGQAALIEHWNGSAWSAQDRLRPTKGYGNSVELDLVSCSAATACEAIGQLNNDKLLALRYSARTP